MSICPTCQKKTILGELFCKECGAQLFTINPGDTVLGATVSIKQKNSGEFTRRIPDVQGSRTARVASISLLILNSHNTLNLSGQEAFTLGRAAEGQSIHPDIDLSPFQGYEMGVSRLHASIRIGTQATATDLGSSNGTRLNSVKMISNKAYPLRHEDVLTLGKLKIQVLLRLTE